MSASLPAGLKHFPVSRYFIYTTIALPLVASLTSTKYIYYFSYDPFILEYKQFWRILTYQLAFTNESEVLLGIILFYQFRNLERLFSSHKYASLAFIFYLYNLILTILLISLDFYTGSTWLNNLSSGPIGILFALFALYRIHVPTTYRFELYGFGDHKIVLTDRFLLSTMGFQLAVTQGWKGIGSTLYGWIIGELVERRILPGKNWRLPFWKRLAQRKAAIRDPISRENTPASEQENTDNDNEGAETRPLTTQFFDTFRRGQG